MAAKLKNLKIKKVDFVDEGANPDADIKMRKRREAEEQLEEERKESGNILKKLLHFIGKAAGMDPDEIDSAVDEIQKNDSASFSEKMGEVNNRKIADEMWDICYALQSSFCSILNDEELESTGIAAAMQESLDQFYAVAKESIGKWSGGKSANIAKRDGEMSEKELEIMKSAVERLHESIQKADSSTGRKDRQKEEDGTDNDNSKGDEEEMRIDKSKLTDAERAFLESIEKRYGEAGGNDSGSGNAAVLDSGEQTSVPAAAEPAVTKSMTQTGNEAAATPPTDDADHIYKGLHPAVKAELEELKKFREKAEERELAEIAKRYAIIGKKEEELVPMLKGLKAAGGSAYQDMIAVLDQAVDTVEKSGIFSEIGKSGHGGKEGGAWAEADTKAVELMKSKTGLTKAQALDEVFMTDPELAKRCEEEG